ncbi:hypothetical protein EU803_17955 [Loktanella sp. IMCC34160]|uniref:EF-hand domain-containing protein n=1 Tax=Loktanella sp. IMCC34160 TaxID=2510646 RepID=UPI00101D0593|nr:EF-hand domain-containing protein [Loktanella sp. IMCC34160]RYG89356.1 hypothetical protein EU803_17955 [Loktanella sp. IMCC34160]
MKTPLLLAAIAAGFVATGANAAGFGHDGAGMGRGMGPQMGPMMDFATLDANGDGSLTLEELQAAPANRFAAQDTDGDGALSPEELTAAMVAEITARAEDRVTRMIGEFDENGDGLLQAEEMPQPGGRMGRDPFERMFSHMDADEDGVVTAEEFETAMAEMGEHRQGHGRGEGRGRHGN